MLQRSMKMYCVRCIIQEQTVKGNIIRSTRVVCTIPLGCMLHSYNIAHAYLRIITKEQNVKTPYSAKTGVQGTRVAQDTPSRCTGILGQSRAYRTKRENVLFAAMQHRMYFAGCTLKRPLGTVLATRAQARRCEVRRAQGACHYRLNPVPRKARRGWPGLFVE